jgi:hypothetical protein
MIEMAKNTLDKPRPGPIYLRQLMSAAKLLYGSNQPELLFQS